MRAVLCNSFHALELDDDSIQFLMKRPNADENIANNKQTRSKVGV